MAMSASTGRSCRSYGVRGIAGGDQTRDCETLALSLKSSLLVVRQDFLSSIHSLVSLFASHCDDPRPPFSHSGLTLTLAINSSLSTTCTSLGGRTCSQHEENHSISHRRRDHRTPAPDHVSVPNG